MSQLFMSVVPFVFESVGEQAEVKGVGEVVAIAFAFGTELGGVGAVVDGRRRLLIEDDDFAAGEVGPCLLVVEERQHFSSFVSESQFSSTHFTVAQSRLSS